MRTLAIDLGTRRVGLALSDDGGRFVTPHDVLEVSSPPLAIEPIKSLVISERVERIVIGLPLNMDGTAGPAVKQVLGWAEQLFSSVPDAQIVFVDERLSSFTAEQQLIDRKRSGEKLTRDKKKRQLDALAAAAFLQDFLDGKLSSIAFDEARDLIRTNRRAP